MDDSISRQGAIDSIESHLRTATEPYQLTLKDKIMNHAFEIAISCVYTLPSVPERKKGKWVLSEFQNKEETDNDNYQYECSCCGHGDIHAKNVTVPYCWFCGAEME